MIDTRVYIENFHFPNETGGDLFVFKDFSRDAKVEVRCNVKLLLPQENRHLKTEIGFAYSNLMLKLYISLRIEWYLTVLLGVMFPTRLRRTT